MRVTLRGADGHPRRLGDLVERVAERVLQQDDLRLLRRDPGERLAQLAAKLRVAGRASGIVVEPCLQIVGERLVHARLPALGRVAAGVHDEPVQPGRELRLAAELLQPHTDLRERLLGRVGGILRVPEQMAGQPLDLRSVPLEQRLESLAIAVLRPRHENRVTELLVGEIAVLPQLEPDRAGFAAQRWHPTSLDPVSGLDARAVLPLLRGRLGKPYRYVESCPSTQRLLGEEDSEGATVATDHQTEGRGRLGRTWEDEPGKAILMSVLLRPAAPTPLWPELSLIAGDAVATALRTETGLDASLRHPNDVVIAGRKLAGVLPEASLGRVVLGIGVNVNQTADELPAATVKPATSLRIELRRELERAPLIAAILLELELGYDSWSAAYRR
jgi:biotin-[acetyl-CoA-carboxylase] ligase BirA-like protein